MSKVHAALQHLHAQIDWKTAPEDGVVVVLNKNSILLSEEGFTGQQFTPSVDVIGKLMSHVSMEMCIDCLQVEYLYKDPFFVSLAKAYVEFLAATYGPEVSLSREMATAFIKNDLTDYKIVCTAFDREVEVTKVNVDIFKNDNYNYKMLVNV